MKKRFLLTTMAVMGVVIVCSGCGQVQTDSHLATAEKGTSNVVAEESETTEVHTDESDVSDLEVVNSIVSQEIVVNDTECSESTLRGDEEDTSSNAVAEEMETEASSEETTESTESTEADVPEDASEVTTESSAEETTEEPVETNSPMETPVEQTTEEAVEERFVAYDPNYIVALCNEKIKAYGKILIWENLDNLLAEGKITQEEYNEYYPFDGMENSYYSVFVETDLSEASTIVGEPLRSEEEIADYIVGMLALETGDVVAVSYAGVYEGNHYDFYEFRCHR